MATVKNKNERDFRLITNANQPTMDFNKIKVGKQTLSNDVALDLDKVIFGPRAPRRKISKEQVEKAIAQNNIREMRRISQYFFRKSGIYSRLCRYMAYLFKYDWFITPMVYDKKVKDEKVIEGWYKSSRYLENSKLKRSFGEIALKVIREGCYYGYRMDQASATFLQELPSDYCRSRYELNGQPAVEFNLKYFDDAFNDVAYRTRVVKMFPKEIQKAYVAYLNGTLPKDFKGDTIGWYLLDPSKTVKFNLNGSDAPLFMSVIPKLLDLEGAQDLDRKKMLQQILRIIIQKMPIDKNGDLIFDVQEAQALHSNAVNMLGDAVGVNVLTTFADVQVEDLSDNSNVSSVDQLDKIERTLFNEAGVSQLLFNADGNVALEKSIANDESTMMNLVYQFADYAESLLAPYNKNPKRLYYKVEILPTTIFNYKDLSKQYKELTSVGFSKLLPQVALGQSQSAVIATAKFENELMDLNSLFVPPQSSATITADNSVGNKDSGSNRTSAQDAADDNNTGRPELDDEDKSDKTIANREAEGKS